METDHEIVRYIIHFLTMDKDEYTKISKRCIIKAGEFYYMDFAKELLKLL